MSEFDISAMMGQVQQLQEQMGKMQQELEDVTVEGAAGGGMVKVVATAGLRIKSIAIDPAVMGEDRDMLQDLVTAAVNAALDRAREKANESAQQRLGSMLPPGMAGQIPGL
ncbi:MAG: YbaB/EbfC family nucleoid-associated protein [Deltaproteobacteria bacterium]|nr:YbaB/EbfC family nucleoid-associated protein [Deltaproteobacteria bacterium]